jgi:hypothetical protein
MFYASGIQLNPASREVVCAQNPQEGEYVQQGSVPVWWNQMPQRACGQRTAICPFSIARRQRPQ